MESNNNTSPLNQVVPNLYTFSKKNSKGAGRKPGGDDGERLRMRSGVKAYVLAQLAQGAQVNPILLKYAQDLGMLESAK